MQFTVLSKSIILGFTVFSLSGCFFKKKPAVVVPTVVVPQPQPAPTPEPAKETPPPKESTPAPQPAPPVKETRPTTPKIEKPSPAPVKRSPSPRTTTQAPAQPIPQLGTILTPTQRAQYQQTLDESLNRAKNLLIQTRGRKLSASQTESATRVRSFIRQAEEIKAQDLTTAVQLARRADLLAQQLAQSLR